MISESILDDVVIVRGGGDIATGTIQKLWRAGMKLLVLEVAEPTAIRRTIALSEAVKYGTATVEGMTAIRIEKADDCSGIWQHGDIPVIVDPTGASIAQMQPIGVVDAILAKKNLGTNANMAPIVIALGPGFIAPSDAHIVVETMRGHTLGSLIFSGSALPNTGTPAMIGGRAAERVLRAPCDGKVDALHQIGDILHEGDEVFKVAEKAVTAPFSGILRGIIEDGIEVTQGFKIADIDPRLDSDCNTITDKARCLGGAVLEAYLYLRRKL